MRYTATFAKTLVITMLLFGAQSVAYAQQSPPSVSMTGPSQKSKPGTIESVEIAFWDKSTNSVMLREDRLAKTFEDGTPIDSFRIKEMHGAMYLIREGKDRNGNCIKSSIALEADEESRTLALMLNGGGGDRCRGFFCSLCADFVPGTGCSCTTGWFCNHENRATIGALEPSMDIIP